MILGGVHAYKTEIVRRDGAAAQGQCGSLRPRNAAYVSAPRQTALNLTVSDSAGREAGRAAYIVAAFALGVAESRTADNQSQFHLAAETPGVIPAGENIPPVDTIL